MMGLLFAPLELVYRSVVRARNARFDRSASQRLQWPVVSIGNLSLGGSGKTPLVISLAQMLLRAGVFPDVLSRGYGRTSKVVERVAIAGSAHRFGDEPLLIARATGVPVYVGASRFEAGALAEKETPAEGRHLHLLDDGFQHRQLARQFDIVVIHRSDLQQRLLPAGRLREPISSLRRADAIVMRQEDGGLEPALLRHLKPKCRVWHIRRRLILNGTVERAVAFCAIARPEEFFISLAAQNIGIAEQIRFRDHHQYSASDIQRLAAAGKRVGCDAFVVTAKDDVKLNDAMRQQLTEVAPLRVADLTVEFEEESAVLAALLRLADTGGM